MLPVSRIRGHKEWAPGRKSDPTYDMNWRRQRVAAFHATDSEDPMKNLVIALDLNDPAGRVYVGDGIVRRHIPDEGTLTDLRALIARKGGDSTVERFANIGVLGVDVGQLARQADVGWARDQVAGWLGAADPEGLGGSTVLDAARDILGSPDPQ